MRKALLPMLVCLALCGAATTAMVMSSARAEPGPHKPLMVAVNANPDLQLAANDAPDNAPPRNLRRRSPDDIAARMKQMCNDGYARQAAQLTYLETSLQLTAVEQPLFQRWKNAKLTVAHRDAENCAQRPLPQPSAKADRQAPNPGTMMARQEERLKQRLADIETERPALEAFYNVLSPAQKTELVRASMRDRMGGGGMMRHRMFADAMGPRGPMAGGPMADGPMDRGPMGGRPMAPPPPDAPQDR